MNRPFSIADMVRAEVGTSKYRQRSIVNFAQSEYGVNQKLFPAQKFALKLFNREPMDDTHAEIKIDHPIDGGTPYYLTEMQYFELLYIEKRINVSPDEYMDMPVIEYLLPWGRRGSKSTVISIINAYEISELLQIPNPQKYFGIVESDRISITYIGLGQKNAEKLFSKSAKVIASVRSLQKHLLERPTNAKLKLFTTDDLENEKMDDRGIRMHSLELGAFANSPGVRGDNNITYVCEEFAHFNQAAKSTKEEPLDVAIYDAISPSAAGFRHPSYERMVELHAMDNRYPEPNATLADQPYGKGYILSSPLNNKGKFYTMCMEALEGGVDSGRILLNMPTWEANPTVAKMYLVKKWTESPASFDREFGAKFTKGGQRWIRNLGFFYRAFDNRLSATQEHGNPNRKYFMGLDFALSNDGAAVAIVSYDEDHEDLLPTFDEEGKIIEHGSEHSMLFRYRTPEDDEKQEYQPKKGRYLLEFAATLYPEEGQTLLLHNIMDWVSIIFGKYPIVAGIFDQWSGEVIQQEIDKRASLKGRLMKVNFGEMLNSDMAKTFMGLINADEARFPEDDELETQLLGLKEEVRRKHIIKVEVPAHEGHDDLYDAAARAFYLAKAYQQKNEAILELMLGANFAAQLKQKVMSRIGGQNGHVNRAKVARNLMRTVTRSVR